MMGFTWCVLGLLSSASGIILWRLSRRYRLNWVSWGGLVLGVLLTLFTIAWCVGSVLEGVPRAASMGLIFFGMPGILLLTVTVKYIDLKIEKIAVTAPPPSVEAEAKVSAVEDAWPHFEIPQKDLPRLEIPFAPQLSRLAKALGGSLRYLAYGSLIAAFIIGLITSKKDYETMVKVKFPDVKLTKVNDSPVVFQLGEKIDGMGNYVVISEGQGYGGPFVIGVRIMDDAKVHEVMLLDNRETPAYRQKVEDAKFPAQFADKNVTDDFLPGVDIDIVSGATISTMAGTEAIRKAAHIAATQYFKREANWQKEPWKFGLEEVLILIVFILAFFPKMYGKKPWSTIYLAATIAIVGFYLNASISIGNLAGLVMGFIPGLKTHLIWWILVIGTIAAIIITGKNVYCFRICPFYGIEYILGKIGGGKLKPSTAVLKRSKSVANFLLWLSLMTIFLSSHPALGSYEPFAMMFSLNGVGIQWFILPLALIGSFFMSAFWCRFFCPCGHALTKLVQFRKKLIQVFRNR
jgi:Na+-translocating ferredoxin:NAD+ oxidoreductase RnfG subunit